MTNNNLFAGLGTVALLIVGRFGLITVQTHLKALKIAKEIAAERKAEIVNMCMIDGANWQSEAGVEKCNSMSDEELSAYWNENFLAASQRDSLEEFCMFNGPNSKRETGIDDCMAMTHQELAAYRDEHFLSGF